MVVPLRPGLAAAMTLGAVCLCPLSAKADGLTATRGQPLREVAHEVALQLEDGVATYRVRRTFANDGRVSEEACLEIDLPTGAAATGLRIRARDRWYDGELLEAEEAEKHYEELVGKGLFPVKDPALLYWRDEGELGLRVFPVLAGSTSTVEYTLTAPINVEEGRWRVDYPAASATAREDTLPLAKPVVRVRAPHGDATTGVWIGGARVGHDTPTVLEQLGSHDAYLAIEVAAAPVDMFAARYGRVQTEGKAGVARLDVDVAPQLSELPRGASVVFVMDASFSSDDLDAQLEMARAYLHHLPDAAVQIVVFRRRAEVLFPDFVPVAKLDEALQTARERGALELGNGSALDLGLEEGVRILKGRPSSRRLVVSTDALMRSRFSVPKASKMLRRAPRGTVTHVVEMDGYGEGYLWRTDDHALAPLAVSTGGVAFNLQLPHEDARQAETVLGLVRPIQIDHVEIRGLGALRDLEDEYADEPEGVLQEGESLRLMTLVDRLPAQVEVRGQLWSTPIRRGVRPSRGFNRATAAFVISEGWYLDLEDDVLLRVAQFGRVVSPLTSYLAIEPGVRSSIEGFERSSGLIGKGGGGGTGIGSLGMMGSIRPTPLRILIEDDVWFCADHHAGGQDWSLGLVVETTFNEVVDVRSSGNAPKELQTCVREAIWARALPDSYVRSFDTHPVTFDSAMVRRSQRP